MLNTVFHRICKLLYSNFSSEYFSNEKKCCDNFEGHLKYEK